MIESIEKDFNFKVSKTPENDDIEKIVFKDGREYKLQHPTFFELHDALTGDNMDSSLLKLGLKCLFPLNEKSPKIDEKYLNKNKKEGLLLWSKLLRGLLCR